MPTYDLKSLSAYDFELLTKDLLEAELHLPLETFTTGRDSGIDIRYSRNKRNSIIVQCKHYANSRVSDLFKTLNIEKPKVDKLKPDRYLLATSLGLTPDAKSRIEAIVSPHIKSAADILGLEAINSLITKHKAVEKKHYKLWMTSSEVLRHILHSPVYNRSSIDKNLILRKTKVYVQNRSFRKALKILEKNHYCIISGIPGIGKTTLAEVLTLKYLTRGYELVSISTNIDDAYKVLDEDQKQIFLFDDFLGSTFFENRLGDNSLLKLIEHVSRSKNKRFILTTREHILQQAIGVSEGYARAQLRKCIVTQEDYTRKIKAHILYNHLFFSELDETHILSIIKDRLYLDIVNHENFSPRIIEWMTNALNVQNISASQYGKGFIAALNSPKVIWRIAFEKHLTPSARSVVVLLGMIYDRVSLSDFAVLLRAWNNHATKDQIEWNILFKSSLRELDGTFIRIDGGSTATLRFHNPSIKDFISDYLEGNNEVMSSFLNSDLKYWDQFCYLGMSWSQKKDIAFLEPVIRLAEMMLENIYLPTLELEPVYGQAVRKKEKDMFSKLRFLCEITKEFEGPRIEKVRDNLLSLAVQETNSEFVANYDAYFVYMELVRLRGTTDLSEVLLHIEDRIRKSKSYKELNELSDIADLIRPDPAETEEVVRARFNELDSEYELEDSLYQLRITEEAVSEFVEKREISAPSSLDEIRTRIAELETEEAESEVDYDDGSESSRDEEMSERREIADIDEMFSTL